MLNRSLIKTVLYKIAGIKIFCVIVRIKILSTGMRCNMLI